MLNWKARALKLAAEADAVLIGIGFETSL